MLITQSHSNSAKAGEPTALQQIYAWFAALATHDLKTLSSLHGLGTPVDITHPLRHTTALMEATRLGRTALVEWLLARGAAPALLCGIPKGSPLHCAIRRRHWHSVKKLLAYTEYATVVDGYGATLMHALCVEPQSINDMPQALMVAEELLQKKCSLDALDHEGATALHHCTVNGAHELTELLLKHGANPNALIPDSWVSPLMIAALEKNTDLASLLMQYGANAEQRTRDGMTPAHVFPGILKI